MPRNKTIRKVLVIVAGFEFRSTTCTPSSFRERHAVDAGSMEQGIAEELFVNVNDGTNEGLRYKGKKIMTVQFHPEANPGPQDTAWLFDKFIEMVKEDSYACVPA